MMASSHVPFAAFSWLGYCLLTGTIVTPAQTAIAAFCGLLPDIDTPGSRIGRMFPYISTPIGAIIGHRGFSHSLICLLLVFFGVVWLSVTYTEDDYWKMALLPVSVGYLSHLIGDMFTPSGIPLLWPSRKPYTFPFTFRTNSLAEHLIVPPLCLAAFVAYYKAYHGEPFPEGFANMIGLTLKDIGLR